MVTEAPPLMIGEEVKEYCIENVLEGRTINADDEFQESQVVNLANIRS